MRYQLLIFDWDGTLSDSVGAIVANMREAIDVLGLPPRRDEEIAELIGLGFMDGLRRLFPLHDPALVLRQLGQYRMRVPGTASLAALFPGVADLLPGLQRAGYRLAVATGKSRLGLDRSLASHPELAGVFELTRCADETADKPNPRMLNEILAVTGVRAEAALMIGDTEYDAAMARAIAMDAVGVATGVHDAGRQQRAGACTVLGDVAALPGWLARQ